MWMGNVMCFVSYIMKSLQSRGFHNPFRDISLCIITSHLQCALHQRPASGALSWEYGIANPHIGFNISSEHGPI
jgi:hypothetical protein